MDDLSKTLKLLGLSVKQARLYETSFKLGPATVNEVAKAARVQRSTAYLLIEELISKGYLEEDLTGYRKKIFAAEPRKLLQLLAAKQRQFRRQELELEENLPKLQSEYLANEFRPKVKVFEGNKGLLNIWQDILSTKGEILLWTNQETETLVFNEAAHNKFVEERVKKGLKIKVLAVNSERARKLIPTDEKALRETKLLPDGVNFSAETYIYDNKVAMLDYNKDIIGVIIESIPFSSYHKSIFEMSWNQY